MSTSVTAPGRVWPKPTVPNSTLNVYEFWDCVFQRAGVLDYTEGYYNGDRTLPYEVAQRRQVNYLLDQIDCCRDSRVLDVGCGNGTLLDEVRRRGGEGVGITISPQQVEFCRRRGLDVHLLDYRDLNDDWSERFDSIVANGSIEHFVQPADAAAGRADAIYREMFEILHRVIDPRSECRKVVDTTIHFGDVHIDPQSAMKSPWSFRWFSSEFQYALLAKGFGGYYPTPGQFEQCAEPFFELIHERDATHDYYLTSEEWLKHGRRSLLSLKQWGRLLPYVGRHPRHAATMMFSLLVAESWNWQFRTEHPPMKHLWQTWRYLPS